MNSTDQKGTFRGEEVIFGPVSKNDAFRGEDKKTIWVKNSHGKPMCLPIPMAWEFVNKPGRKYEWANEEDIPFVPEEKIRPYDPEHTAGGARKANTEFTGREVSEMANSGENPLGDEITYKEMRAIAKENEIKTHGMKKDEIKEILLEQGLIA